MLSEEVAIGSIGFSTYKAYIKAAGGWAMLCLVLSMYVISAGSIVFTDWWLSEWIGSLTKVRHCTNIMVSALCIDLYQPVQSTQADPGRHIPFLVKRGIE